MAHIKRRLLFDYFSGDPSQISENSSFKQKIQKIQEENVKTVFVLTSGEIALEPYLELIKLYEKNGFTVNSVNIETLDDDHFVFMKNAVEDINSSFRKGNCLIISFGDSVAGALFASYYLTSGRKLKEAVEKARLFNKNFLSKDEEIDFLRRFRKYLNISADDDEDNDVLTGQKEEIIPDAVKDLKETRPADEYIQSKDTGVKEVSADAGNEEKTEVISSQSEDLKGYGHFYSSIRFKLVTISSIIVILSLTGMMLLASYFFKRDNTVRIQESNLYVAEVVALKVKSDLQAIIDKTKLIADTMLHVSGKENYTDMFIRDDRDILFIGIALPSKNGSPSFYKTVYNTRLMSENRITEQELVTVQQSATAFNESFSGESVINNISQGFQVPLIGISYPLNVSAGKSGQPVLICFLKLERFLQAFQGSGITKTFMVNRKGDILAHSDSAIVLGGGNYLNLPIVKSMLASPSQNGQQRYSDENEAFHLGSFNKIGIGGLGVISTVEESLAYQEVYNQQRRDIYLTGIVLTLVILIIFFFGKTLTTPIIRLLVATKRIKSGDYNVQIRPASKDEIGELTHSFMDMAKGLEEREKIKTAFGKFVNPELAEMVTKNEVKLGGEAKVVAIMFSDIRDFTSISEKLLPEQVVEFLNAYLTRMVECVDRTGGIVDKFIGDAIMAEWGVPVSKGNDTENAVNCTLLMRKALIELNKINKETGRPVLKIGCGINTGRVLAGQIGSEDRMEYTVMGDPVNLASRIEALNKPFGTDILISQDTYDIVKEYFAVEPMSPIRVKGKEQPQQIYAVLGRLDDPSRPASIVELRNILGTKEQPFKRRREDQDSGSKNSGIADTEEVKYEILA